MKNWIILGLAGIGSYAIYQWWSQSRKSPAGNSAQNAHHETGFFAAVTGRGDLFASPLQSGIPSFDQTVVLNRPDQFAASKHSNYLATIPGGYNYVPAFGPNENRGTGIETM